MKNFHTFSSHVFTKILFAALLLLGSTGISWAQSTSPNPFKVSPVANATWDGATRVLTVTGNATIANIDPSAQVTAKIEVNKEVTAITLNGVNLKSADMSTGANYAFYYPSTEGTLTLNIEGENYLTAGKVNAEYASAAICMWNVGFSGSNLSLKGTGTLHAAGGETEGVSMGIRVNAGLLSFASGTLYVSSAKSESSSFGILASEINITGGSIYATSNTSPSSIGIMASNGLSIRHGNLDVKGGKGVIMSIGISIVGGQFTQTSGSVTVVGGNAVGANPSRGIDAPKVLINSGTITVTGGTGSSSMGISASDSIIINGGKGTIKTASSYSTKHRAFSKQPVGLAAPAVWDVKEATWDTPIPAENPFIVTPEANAIYDTATKTLTVTSNATLSNKVVATQAAAKIIVNADVTAITLNGVNYKSPDIETGANNAFYYESTTGILTITTEGQNTITAGSTASLSGSYGISTGYDATGGSLVFNGTGTLNVSSAKGGGSTGIMSVLGNITINGGTINATAGETTSVVSSGIGSSSGNILINGGTISATGGKGPKGSNGFYALNGTITINGGRGTAKTSETYSGMYRAFSKQPIGTVVIAGWDAKEVSWENVAKKPTSSVAFSIYPNPTSEVLNIECEADVKHVEIYDLSGRMLMQFANSQTINVSELSRGNYVVRILTSKGHASLKFVKE